MGNQAAQGAIVFCVMVAGVLGVLVTLSGSGDRSRSLGSCPGGDDVGPALSGMEASGPVQQLDSPAAAQRHTEPNSEEYLSGPAAMSRLLDDLMKKDFDAEATFVNGLLQRREFLASGGQDKYQKIMTERSIAEHMAKIADYTKRMEVARARVTKGQMSTAIAMEFHYAFLKTSLLAPEYWEYYQNYLSALGQAADTFGSGTGAFYLAEECRHRKLLLRMHPGMPEFRLGEREMNDELALVYYAKAFDNLAHLEPAAGNRSNHVQPKWIVAGIMQGMEATLKDLNREQEIPATRQALREKYSGNRLGSQLAEWFQAENP
jgi:hypothetical protein